jgi:exopolysaccharide production protein ExoZ
MSNLKNQPFISLNTNLPPFNTIQGIQYLRAIAAVLVLGFHLSELYPEVGRPIFFGSAGVDIFFILSGFIMAYTTRVIPVSQNIWQQSRDFIWRRFIRVMPLYWIVLLWTYKPIISQGEFIWDDLKDFFFIPRYHETGFIWPNLILGWTINYEIMFYILFAFTLLFGKWRYGALIFIFSILISAGQIFQFQSAPAKFYTDLILLEFLMGVGLFKVFQWEKGHSYPPLVLWLTMLVASGCIVIDNGSVHRAFADGLAATVLTWATIHLAKKTHWHGLLLLGNASYSIYLFHFVVIGLLWRLTHIAGKGPMEQSLLFALNFFLCIVVGVLIHRFIEQPLLVWIRKITTLKSSTPSRKGFS